MTMEEYVKTQSLPKNKKDKRFQKILKILCLSLIIFSLYTILKWQMDNTKIQQIGKEIDKNIQKKTNYEQGQLVNPPKDKNSDYYYYVNTPFYEVNLNSLVSRNKDTVAFIEVRNTNIHYPVVQTTDNSYYLKHDFHKKENRAGWVFMDYRNNIDNLGDNTVIYGHARLDGSIFGSLKNVLSSSWQKNRDNYVIFLSTKKENMIFQIFSIYTIAKESYYITPSFSDDKKKQAWLDTIKKRNIAPIYTDVNVKDKILTLSTCQNVQDGRVVVHAKLIKKQKVRKAS